MKYGVIGEHLRHSFSKEIHNKIGDYVYEICEIPQGKLGDFFGKRDFLAINVTIPYKEAVIPYLDEISDSARRIGAVNTVVNRNGRLYGYNTDYLGLKSLILRNGIDVKGKKALIFGAGGTAKTGHCVLSDLCAREIIHVGRNSQKCDVLYGDVAELHSDAEFILNTTPVGMFPENQGMIMDISAFPKLVGLIDAVYNPLRTNIVLEAGKMGAVSEAGLYMLVSQAVYASELFFEKKYEPSVCENIFKDILKQKENIVLVGMPSSGKTIVGKHLSEITGKVFCDTDDEIVKRIGTDIPSYFAKYGEESFRKIETEVIAEISKRNGLIIATGGGAVLKSENVRSLEQNGRIYFLDRALELLTPTGTRPLSSSLEALKKRYEERYEIYKKCAHVCINANGTVNEIAEFIKGEFYK